jgi:pilus assembly protein Flp/PilA
MFKTKRNKKESGQGLVEYALILVLVAIVVIAVLMLLGPIIGGVFSTINDSLSGVGGGGGVAANEPGASYVSPMGNTPAECQALGISSGGTLYVHELKVTGGSPQLSNSTTPPNANYEYKYSAPCNY